MIEPEIWVSKQKKPTISSGSLNLDIALGSGGYPPGSIIEISGKTTSGKTVLSLQCLKAAQNFKRACAFIDADRSLDVHFIQRMGIRFDDLFYCEPENTEQALEIVAMLAESGSFGLIVLDSVPALTPIQWTPESDPEHVEIINDRLISTSLHRLSRIIKTTGTSVIFTNDYIQQISAAYHNLSRNPHRITLKLLADYRICLFQQEMLKHKEKYIGQRIQARIIKNRNFPFLNTTYFDIIYRHGINRSAEIFYLGEQIRLFEKLPEGFFHQTVHLGKTSSQVVQFLDDNETIREDIEGKIRRTFLSGNYSAAK